MTDVKKIVQFIRLLEKQSVVFKKIRPNRIFVFDIKTQLTFTDNPINLSNNTDVPTTVLEHLSFYHSLTASRDQNNPTPYDALNSKNSPH